MSQEGYTSRGHEGKAQNSVCSPSPKSFVLHLYILYDKTLIMCIVFFWVILVNYQTWRGHGMTQIPASRICCGCIFKYTWTTEILWRKRDGVATHSWGECLWEPWPLPQEESASALALTGFYCFSRPLTSKKVLLYYAKVCFGWLSFSDKGEGVAEYIKGGRLQCKRRNGLNS